MERFCIAQAAAASVLPCYPGKQITGASDDQRRRGDGGDGGEEMEEMKVRRRRRWRRGNGGDGGDGGEEMEAHICRIHAVIWFKHTLACDS